MKKDWKAGFSIVGPGPTFIMEQPDLDEREIKVELEVTPPSGHDKVDRFQMVVRSHRYSSGWSEPMIHPIQWTVYGHLDIDEADHALKRMKAFQTYVGKLPLHPRNLQDWVSCLLSFVEVDAASYVHYPDEHTKPSRREERATRGYLVREVERAWDELLK